MYVRILFYLLFLLSQTPNTFGQVSPEVVAKAQAELAEAKQLFSTEHIEYAKAALKLSGIYYQDEDAQDEATSLAFEALRFIRKDQGDSSDAYQEALQTPPAKLAVVIDATLASEEAVSEFGENSVPYAIAQTNLAAAYIDLEEDDPYAIFKDAFRTYLLHSDGKDQAFWENAKKKIPLFLIRLIKEDITLDFAKVAYPYETQEADALVAFSKLAIEHYYNDLVFIGLDDSYARIKKALDIYKFEHQEGSEAYQAALNAFSPEMAIMYRAEAKRDSIYANYLPFDDDYIIYLRGFLKKVERYNDDFLPYDVDDVFEQDLNYLKTFHDGADNKYYQIIKDIRDAWNNDETENELVRQTNITRQMKAEFGPKSIEYAVSLIDLSNLEIEDYDGTKALLQFIKAFDILKEVEENLPYLLDTSLYQKYIGRVKAPFPLYISREIELQIIKETFGSKSNEYAEKLFSLGLKYTKTRMLDERGENYFRQAMRISSQQNQALSLRWLDSLFLGEIDDGIGIQNGINLVENILKKTLSLPNIKSALEKPLAALEQIYGPYSIEYGDALQLLAKAYYQSDSTVHHEKAWRIYQQVLAIYRNKEGIHDNYFFLLVDLTRQIEAKDCWTIEQNIQIFEMLFRTFQSGQVQDTRIASYAIRYANWHYKNNRIIDAEPLYKKVIAIYKDKSAKEQKSRNYLKSLYNLARIYRKTGRYKAAERAYTTSLKVSKASNSRWYTIQCMDDLGLLAQNLGQNDLALKRFQEALDLLYEYEDSHPQQDRYRNLQNSILYIKIMRHIGRFYLEGGDMDQAINYYKQIRKFEEEERSPVQFDKDVSLKRDLAILYAQLGDSVQAEQFYRVAIDSIKDFGEKADAIISFANFYENKALDSSALYYNQALEIDLSQIEHNYSNLSEKERLQFLQNINTRINSFFDFTTRHPDSALTVTALNAHLKIKGLALETSTNIQSICYATQNVTLKNDCLLMQRLRKQLSQSATLSAEVQNDLSRTITELEKKIGYSSKELRNRFGKLNKNLDFEQLQQIMWAEQEGDSLAMAIDYFIVETVDNYGDKVELYYALIINTTDSVPHIIPLATEAELEDVLGPDVAPNSINYISDELESHYLYQLIWEPILPYIKDAKELHICPTGILSKVAFGTLQENSYNHRRVMDKWSIHYYSSFRDLLNPQVNLNINGIENIGLIGGVKFTFSNSEFEQYAEEEGINLDSIEMDAADSYTELISTSRGVRGESFNYLPGTLREVQAIGKLFHEKGWVTKTLKGTMATEEYALELTSHSPAILHIATHGYFFSAPNNDDNDDNFNSNHETIENKIANLSNPLLRSGLALGDINRIWRGGPEIPGLENGNLTALEVADMDLFNTKLVVLSACETGRGDIDNNEGIMGLRRAFKTAGAKQLIISLWKVPDDQTSELMQLFYKQYLSGLSAHKAFENAQHIMRKRYRNPYYWAAFLLIE